MNRLITRRFRQKIIASTLIALTSVASFAEARPNHEEEVVRARVISSVPIFQTINEPSTECWTESVGHESRRSHDGSGSAVIGAIAGGLLGSTVGKGNGRIAAAAVGAATGAVIGDRMGNRYVERPRQLERCQTSDKFRQVLEGYDVRYRYQGRDYSTQLPYDPGRYLNLRVSFVVADDQRDRRDEQRDDR